MEHTLSPNCRLKPVIHAVEEGGLLPINAQFFYSSLIPIDDPLSTGPAIRSSDSKGIKGQLRPFSYGDNNILENAWLTLISRSDADQHSDAREGCEPSPAVAEAYTERRTQLIQSLALKHWQIHRASSHAQSLPTTFIETTKTTPLEACCPQLVNEVAEKLEYTFCDLARKINPNLGVDKTVQDVVFAINQHQTVTNNVETDQVNSSLHLPLRRTSNDSTLSTPAHSYLVTPVQGEKATSTHKPTLESWKGSYVGSSDELLGRDRFFDTQTPAGLRNSSRTLIGGDGISGKPFVRAGSVGQAPSLKPSSAAGVGQLFLGPQPTEIKHNLDTPSGSVTTTVNQTFKGSSEMDFTRSIDVVVGVARLHMVSLPMLLMKPIYWSPVNDIAVVTRGTWFYRDTMLPVQPAAANQLEAGYQELQPWTETWADEIRCAIDVGAVGEEKVAHRLWPLDKKIRQRNTHGAAEPLVSSHPFCSARCFQGEAAAEGISEPQMDHEPVLESPPRAYANYHVIYKDGVNAFLLRPSLRPSAHYSRRPVFKIMKGVTVGIPVVRGFDRKIWECLQDGRQMQPGKAEFPEPNNLSVATEQAICPACKFEKDQGQVTDLVLVAHGIGQKIAERIESYHFTHAINSFRRAVNMELRSPAVKQVLREGQNGLMILPLNWRTGLSFEDSGSFQNNPLGLGANTEKFKLKDIEPDTIPAVRSMISDVMFDIPFYMSHHKEKMIKALVAEANRVYRLWCRNNPGFAQRGRVHLLAHSLGSAMAIEILSRQPTALPPVDLCGPEIETKFFEFDTTNLFLMGSPAGFFLLLERGTLIPRRGRQKPGADPSDTVASSVVGEAGTFGCLAVDNIYNILAKEDPIAYLLNGAVDPVYAASLKIAYVPTTSVSLLKSMGDAIRNVVPGMSPSSNPLLNEPERPSTIRLPSQLELEVHDFTREEIAEKKTFLLNDNGQIDWFLKSGGGPLEIQYLNMLSAHTSYWTNNDFIRMLCMEIGRKPGRANTYPAMRATKASKQRLSGIK